MSYDLAVWEGDHPPNDQAAAVVFEDLMDRLEEEDEPAEPTPRIRAYVEALLARWPDIDVDPASPWATSPLLSEASGPVIYFPMTFSGAAYAVDQAAALARQHGLNCYDPQAECLRP